MEIISGSQMREMDRFAIEQIGIPSIVLMELAGYQLYEECKDLGKKFLLIASVGNNGGDGLVLARHLHLNNRQVKIFLIGNLNKMTNDCAINYKICKNLNLAIFNMEEEIDRFKEELKESIVIDGLFGTGLSRNIEGIYKDLIEVINKESKYTVSIDLPSGVDGDTGQIWGTAIRADKTVTFHKNKTGLIKAGAEYCGLVKVKYIGVAEESHIIP